MDALTTSEAAELCRVDRRTMLRWVKAKLVPCYYTGGGQVRILVRDLRAFMVDRGMPIPEVLGDAQLRVGIVDDQVQVRCALRAVVRALLPQAEIFEAADGFEAGIMLGAHRPQLLLLDVVMPGLDGVQVCKRLREDPQLVDTEVVVISAYHDTELHEQLRALGCRYLLAKPVHPSVLEGVMRELGFLASPAEVP